MPPTDVCTAPGMIVETLAPGVWRVALPNGHRLVARLLRRDAARASEFTVGSVLTVRVSPGDLSVGVVVVKPV